MLKIKWTFLLAALIAIASAFTTIPRTISKDDVRVVGLFVSGSRYYVATDGSGNPQVIPPEWTEGDEFTCEEPLDLCYVIVEETAVLIFDSALGLYYYESTEIIEDHSGTFQEQI
ncbi:MAG: hypothetical protein J0I32_23295 [Sphingobacteriales bacterium]|nr:hypothetical protein [Sphingobacteriales bacterium]OJW01967.1 MAG: hypothetical protein BGO52_00345 [Sphingobacteriales bacterium 44-61]